MTCVAHPLSSAARAAEDPKPRSFYQVLDDVLADFELDLKNNNAQGLKDLTIRNIATSENVPTSFRQHLELLITERILKNTKTRIIQCLACRAKKAQLNGDQVLISSPETNPAELARLAKMAGIANFMDVAFGYQPSGMVLSLYTTDAESGAVIWSRTYNSETSRSSAFRRGVDYSQVDDVRQQSEYVPTIQYRSTVYYLSEPNFGSNSGCLALGFRMMERYDNRRKEVGFEANYLMDSGALVSSSTSTGGSTGNLYSSSLNLTLLFLHAWNLIGAEENFNQVRGSVFTGVGGTYTSGYLGGLLRGGYEWRLGKRSAISANIGYRPRSTAFIKSRSQSENIGGTEYGLGISLLF